MITDDALELAVLTRDKDIFTMGEGFKGENLSVHMMMNVTTFKDALWCSETARTFATCYIPFPCASSTW